MLDYFFSPKGNPWVALFDASGFGNVIQVGTAIQDKHEMLRLSLLRLGIYTFITYMCSVATYPLRSGTINDDLPCSG